MKFFPSQQNHEQGFTLMEVMVSISIFAIIITIGIGSLLTILGTVKKTRSDREAMDSISYVMDTITRRLRTGHTYERTSNSSIKFVDQDGSEVEFYTSTVVNQNGTTHLGLTMRDDTGPYDITPPNMVIDNFSVVLSGTEPGGADGQPFVRLSILGTITNGQQKTELAVQASVSQRVLDF